MPLPITPYSRRPIEKGKESGICLSGTLNLRNPAHALPCFLLNDHYNLNVLVNASGELVTMQAELLKKGHANTIQINDAFKGTRGPKQLCCDTVWRPAFPAVSCQSAGSHPRRSRQCSCCTLVKVSGPLMVPHQGCDCEAALVYNGIMPHKSSICLGKVLLCCFVCLHAQRAAKVA